ncbi:MAG: response regulator transcription factor [Actinomycetota bacterium]|nr:response regulator transcription factor [Actinomycetota bacterium]
MTLRVLIVDDHAAFRAIAGRLLAADGFAVVGEAGDGASALVLARALRPDVVVLDIQLPGADGFALAAALAADLAPPAVVLVSSRSRTDYGSRIDAAGVRGFIPKAELSGTAVRRVLGPGSS